MDSKLQELFKKILALKKRGEGGEAENAQRMLENLCKKHGVPSTEIEQILGEDKLVWKVIKFKKTQQRLVSQIIANVNLKAKYRVLSPTKWEVGNITMAQYIEIMEKIEFYVLAWEEEQENLFKAFVWTHDLGVNRKKDEKEKQADELSLEESVRIQSLMNGLKKRTLKKQLSQ